MYAQQIKQLTSLLPGTPQKVIEEAIEQAQGNVTHAMNNIFDKQRFSQASTSPSSFTQLCTEKADENDIDSVVPFTGNQTSVTRRRESESSSVNLDYNLEGEDEEEEGDGDSEDGRASSPVIIVTAPTVVKPAPKLQKRSGTEVKVFVPQTNIPTLLLKQFLQQIFKKSNVTEHEFVRESALSRAEYEEQVDEWRIRLTIGKMKENDNKVERMIGMLERFCFYSACDHHEQFLMEVPSIPQIVNEISTQHIHVPVSSIAIGNCPNAGLFFIRGNFVSTFNTASNNYLAFQNRDYFKKEENPKFKVAGSQPYTSFASFEHDQRRISIHFAPKLTKEQPDGLAFAGYRLNLQYGAIVQIVVDMRDAETNSMFLKLKHPPQLWHAWPRGLPYLENNRRVMNLEQTRDWVRVLQWAGDDRSKGCSKEALADSQWLQISFPRKDDQRRTNLSVHFFKIISRLMMRSKAKVSFGGIVCLQRRLPIVTEIESVGSFRADYALKAIISRGSVVTDQLFGYTEKESASRHIFFDYVVWCMKECHRACEEALENLLCAVDERRSVDVLRAFQHMYKVRVEAYRRLALGGTARDVADADLRRSLPANCVLVRKVMITPSRTLFMAPEVMMSNRVVRHFGPEHALRCVFRDDSGGRLIMRDFSQGSDSEQPSKIVTEMVLGTLTQGVQIHDRRYFFLAWSNSQMRDHGCYMYAPIIDPWTGKVKVSIDQIRDKMGDFSGVKNVPKLMSRMGQCFTQAQPTISLTPDMWTVVEDFNGGEGHPESNEKYCFSDGCGRIAPSVARLIARELQLEIIPSCFQLRFKGFKGIVAIDPTLDLIPGPRIVFRKSQQKFLDNDDSKEGNMLEIVKYSMPSPLCFNRPMITILDQVSEAQSKSTHRTLCRKIHYYLERELSTLGAMLMNEKAAAEELTQRINVPIDFNRLRQCGFSLTNEPFFRSMLVAVYRYNISNHLTKAKIFLPGNMGRSMYGIVDETGLLQYGQVFIQYSPSIRKGSDKPKRHMGPVLITKNPAHVPGDVRMFEAVDQPALRHLIDVVVFPRWGPRPHPDEMAGSDLDGDEYCVIFDSDIRFDRNEEAMVYPKNQAEEFEEQPQTEDMVDFFLKYLSQDSIGRMSNAHLIMADKRGLFDDVVNGIALKCSVAVDFPKSGQPAEPLTSLEKSDLNPDYMPSFQKPTYRSPRLNGQLYRKAKKIEEVLELTENTTSVFENEVDRILVPEDVDLFQGADELKGVYRRYRDEYATRMQQLLDEYGISDEAAVVSGHITSLKRLTAMERDDYSFYHTDKIVELRFAKIYNHFRSLFLQEFGEEEDLYDVDANGTKIIRTDGQMHLKARRWYYLAYCDKRRRSRGACRSFAWVVWDVLAAFKRGRLLDEGTAMLLEQPLADCLEDVIDDYIYRSDPDYQEFKDELREFEGVISRYAIAYGDSLAKPLYVIHNWLDKEDFFKFSQLGMKHIARLFIQFCRGIRHGCNGVADSTPMNIIFTEKAPNPPQCLFFHPIKKGQTLIDFLRYLGSQRFALADHVSFSVDDDPNAPVLIRSNSWIPLSQLAFRTYHHMAVSGRFDALRLYEDSYDLMESESKDPIVVPGALLDPEGESSLPSQTIVETLKTWTGVSSIHTREINRGRNSIFLFTVVGTVASRQRLARLLQMDAHKLRQCVYERRLPVEVHDMSL